LSLSSGDRLGPYEILAPLGAGGMGEVYKARDTRLERTVAIKVLPSATSSSPEVRQRFEREARTISQLSHPHICALYDVGRDGETDFLVMEYLEGETLSERLTKGALPLEQTLRYGREIGDALDRAHRHGIVHRDLKPGNVMLTKSGVKLLDFGLAKAVEAPKAPGSLTALPTQAALTQEGTILGTFQYMAPEQLEGREADARTDIFAFGAVLFEMATGKKAFSASTQASLITAIMSREPEPVSSMQPMSPPALDRLVQTCLAKDPEDRWQSAHDVAGELKWISESSRSGMAAPVAMRRRSRERLAWGLGVLLLLGAVVLALTVARGPAAPAAKPVRFQISIPELGTSSIGLAVSPDGSELAYVAPASGSAAAIWLRPFDSLEPRLLAGTEGAMTPFWSPDGGSIGYFAGGSLKVVEVTGGLSRTLSSGANDPRGGTWSRDGTIVFAPDFQSVLLRIPAAGGSATPVTTFDATRKEQTHRWPSFLPDGRHFVYYASKGSGEEPGEIFLGSLDGGPAKHLMSSVSMAVFAPPGYLLFDRGRQLAAQPFDSSRLESRGAAIPIAGPVMRIAEYSGYRQITVSNNGVLAYQAGGDRRTNRLVWLDRSGREVGKVTQDASYYAPRLSRDGSRLAVTRWDADTTVGDIWLFDLSRNLGSRLTVNAADDTLGVWSHDDRSVVYSSSRDGVNDLYQIRADRSGAEERLLQSGNWKVPDDVSPDGRNLLYETIKDGRISLWVLPLSGDRTPAPFVAGQMSTFGGQFSPDGRRVVYTSGDSGRPEVYVTDFPGPAGKWQVSTEGGQMPLWRADGREIFYYAPDGNLMAADVVTGPAFSTGAPRALFKIRMGVSPDRQYDVSPDGKRILVAVYSGAGEELPASVVLNWNAGLEKK
jgi:Tol biopolymer transport system component